MKIKHLVEKKQVEQKAPRHKELNDALMSKKSGGHFDKKHDYSRAKEKQKMHKMMAEEELVESGYGFTDAQRKFYDTTRNAKGNFLELAKAVGKEKVEHLIADISKERDDIRNTPGSITRFMWHDKTLRGLKAALNHMNKSPVQEASISSTTAASGKGRRHEIEMVLSTEELQSLVNAVEKNADAKLEKLKAHLIALYNRSGKTEQK